MSNNPNSFDMSVMSRIISRIAVDNSESGETTFTEAARGSEERRRLIRSSNRDRGDAEPNRSQVDYSAYPRYYQEELNRTPRYDEPNYTATREKRVTFSDTVTLISNKGSINPHYYKVSHVKMREDGTYKKKSSCYFGIFQTPSFFKRW